MQYVIKVLGDPIHLYADRECTARGWTPYKEHYTKWEISFDSTFDQRLKANTRVDVKIDIYCRLSFPPTRLSAYGKLVESLIERKILTSLDCIYTLEVYKHVIKTEPYTLVTITERENGKKY